MWKGLVIGIAVGFAVGWIAHPELREPAMSAEPLLDEDLPGRGLEGHMDEALLAAGGQDPGSRSARRERWKLLFTNGSWVGISQALNGVHWSDPTTLPLFDGATVRTLIARAKTALETRSKIELTVYIRALGAADHPDGDAFLFDLINDRSVPLPHPFGGLLGIALEDSEVEGLVDAARKRYDEALAAGDTSWTGAWGWLELIASHGGEAEFVWLLEKARGQQGPHNSEAMNALKKVDSEAGRAFLRDLLETQPEGLDYRDLVRGLSREQPEFVHDILAGQIADTDRGRRTPYALESKELMRAFGDSASDATLADDARLLLGLSDTGVRIASVYAVQQMHHGGLDVTSLEPVVDYPREVLDEMVRVGHGDPGRVIYAIEYNNLAWSETTARSLEAAALAFPGKAEQLGNIVKEMRAELASPWR